MNQMNIQWYPGHMTKTRRQMESDMKQVDAVCEIVDARIPRSSRNPDLDAICGEKPRLIVLNRMDLADPSSTQRWISFFRRQGIHALATDCKSRRGVQSLFPAAQALLQGKIDKDLARGMNRPLRFMVVGIPNVGKSTLINQIAGRSGAKAENRPGVTRGKQWITVNTSLLLLDTPGILWPKFDDHQVGLMLAYTGAIREDIMDIEELACALMELLWQRYPQAVADRYGISPGTAESGYALLEAAARKRGYLLSGGVVHTQRMAKTLLDEFRAGKLGRFTLEEPDQ